MWAVSSQSFVAADHFDLCNQIWHSVSAYISPGAAFQDSRSGNIKCRTLSCPWQKEKTFCFLLKLFFFHSLSPRDRNFRSLLDLEDSLKIRNTNALHGTRCDPTFLGPELGNCGGIPSPCRCLVGSAGLLEQNMSSSKSRISLCRNESPHLLYPFWKCHEGQNQNLIFIPLNVMLQE